MFRTAALALAALTASPVWAEVKVATQDGFTLEYSVDVETDGARAYAAVGEIGQWWEDSHTYAGDAANMTLDLSAGGCFCEHIPGGGQVEHGRVIVAWPEHMVRLRAELGPLQEMGVNGVLTFAWAPSDDAGRKLRLTATYVVNGPGVGALAPLVDQVIGAQFAGWTARLADRPLS